MAQDSFAPMNRKKTWRDRSPLEGLLREWHGREAGAEAILKRLPNTEPLGESVGKALGKLLSAETAFLIEVKNKWPDIAGKDIAQFSEPSRFAKGVLYVEISHPAWRMALGQKDKQMLLDKIAAAMGSKKCSNVIFGASGGRPRQYSQDEGKK